jgi:RNA polymerase sigma factor (sigma-70 family)
MTGLASPVSATTAASLAAAVQLAVAGDETAFARIVSAFHGDLIRVAYVIAGDEQMAEDAAQSTWAIAWRKLGSLRDADRLRPWLVSVAANEARQLVRGQRRRSVTEVKVGSADGTAGDPWGEIDRIDLVNVLRRLRPEDRRLLALRYVTGLDSNEIATIVGLSPSGVRGHLSRLLERLRKELSNG